MKFALSQSSTQTLSSCVPPTLFGYGEAAIPMQNNCVWIIVKWIFPSRIEFWSGELGDLGLTQKKLEYW